MLVVGVFDALATALAYAAAGAPRPLLWAAITGALAAVPFLGYAAVAAMALQLGVAGAVDDGAAGADAGLRGAAAAATSWCGRWWPRDGMRLPFVWVLMGCIGGFGVLGLAGLVIGPVVLSLCQGAVGAARTRGRRLIRRRARLRRASRAAAASARASPARCPLLRAAGPPALRGPGAPPSRRSWCAHRSTSASSSSHGASCVRASSTARRTDAVPASGRLWARAIAACSSSNCGRYTPSPSSSAICSASWSCACAASTSPASSSASAA